MVGMFIAGSSARVCGGLFDSSLFLSFTCPPPRTTCTPHLTEHTDAMIIELLGFEVESYTEADRCVLQVACPMAPCVAVWCAIADFPAAPYPTYLLILMPDRLYVNAEKLYRKLETPELLEKVSEKRCESWDACLRVRLRNPAPLPILTHPPPLLSRAHPTERNMLVNENVYPTKKSSAR